MIRITYTDRKQRPSVLAVVATTICLVALVALSLNNTPYTLAVESESRSLSRSLSLSHHGRSSSHPSSLSLPSIRRIGSCSYATILRGGSLDESAADGGEEDHHEEQDSDNIKDNDSIKENDNDSKSGDESTSHSHSHSLSPIEIATALRLEGKEHHDRGDFVLAAEIFGRAADTLRNSDSNSDNDNDSTNTITIANDASEDYATCRMHQALCHLKSDQHEACIDACTELLQDGSDSDNHNNNNSNNGNSSNSNHRSYSPAITARAYHRRAKARMALGDNAGALQDARTASFLGDGKAVNLYGKLLRETSAASDFDFSSLMNANTNANANANANNPLLSPHRQPGSSLSSSSSSPSSALLESLLSKSNDSGRGGPGGGFPDFSPASLLLGSGNANGSANNLLGAALGSGGGGGMGMAKSVVRNLVKRLDDETTQQTICGFLQKTSKAQLSGLASAAGIGNALEDAQLDRLVRFCHGVTPRGIRRTVRGTKVVVYCVKLARRTLGVIQKYKSLIVAALVLQWTKSAIARPLPINTRAAKKAAKLAAKAAAREAKDKLGEAMKASRAGFF